MRREEVIIRDLTTVVSRFYNWRIIYYDIYMNVCIIIFGFASIWYMQQNNIHFAPTEEPYKSLGTLYIIFCIGNVMICIMGPKLIPVETFTVFMKCNVVGRLSHMIGFTILMHLLCSISHIFALCVGVPLSLWILMSFVYCFYVCISVDPVQLR